MEIASSSRDSIDQIAHSAVVERNRLWAVFYLAANGSEHTKSSPGDAGETQLQPQTHTRHLAHRSPSGSSPLMAGRTASSVLHVQAALFIGRKREGDATEDWKLELKADS